MRAIGTSRALVVGLALLVTGGVSACSANGTPRSAGPGNGQTITPAVTATVGPTSTAASSAPGGVQNLVVSTAVRGELAAAFVAHYGISLSDVTGAAPIPGSVYYAYDPATDTYWASAAFQASSTASATAEADFQGGGGDGMFQKFGTGGWQVQINETGTACGDAHFFPQAVLIAWSEPTSGPGCWTLGRERAGLTLV